MVLDLCQFQHNFTSHWRHDQLLDYASATFWTNHPRQVLGRFIRYKNDALIATYEGYIYVFWSIFYIAADMHMDTHISKSYRGLWISIFCTRGTIDSLAASPIDLRFFFLTNILCHFCSQKSSSTPSGSVPWCSILTSLPVISCIVANIGSAWCLWFLLAALPRYMNDMFQLSMELVSLNQSGFPFSRAFAADELKMNGRWIK